VNAPTTGIHFNIPQDPLKVVDADKNPFVTFIEGPQGLKLQLLHIDLDAGLWVVRVRMAPGLTLPRHQHTGTVFGLTEKGWWKYLEHAEMNKPGTYLFEPAGSIHQLHVPLDTPEETVVWFAINGANVNVNEANEVVSVWDAHYILQTYLDLCEAEGHPRPTIIGID